MFLLKREEWYTEESLHAATLIQNLNSQTCHRSQKRLVRLYKDGFITLKHFKLLKQGYLVERLKSSFRKFYGRYGDLVEQYGVTLSRMLNDILTPDQQWPPYQSDFPPISWPLYRAWPSPNYEWFPWSICNGCG